MLYKVIKLWDNKEINSKLTAYILDGNKKRGAVLICPGGGYGYVSPREAEPIAIQFNRAGYHAFVLDYSVSPYRHPQPLLDASKAMCIIRENASLWLVDEDKIAVCGFSAGGHLAASLGVFYDEPYLFKNNEIKQGMNKPNALILCYPVITSGEFAHMGSFYNLLGQEANKDLLEEMSLERHVTNKTPQTFIWHTFEDKLVPCENSMLFAKALRENDVHFEMHIYPNGPHGLSLANEETDYDTTQVIPHVATWMDLSIEWLKSIF